MLRRMMGLALGLLLVAALLAACKPVTAPVGESQAATTEATTEAPAAAAEEGAGIANPASVFCEDNSGKLEIRDETGGQVGYCIFDDGSECEEWAYMRGECAPGEAAQPATIGMPNPASVFCGDHGGKLEMRQDKNGGEYGMCIFDDASECEEWAYFRGECAPGAPKVDANMPNPASAHCVDQGGELDIRQGDDGEYGMCVFSDGSECEEWALLRGTCAAGEQPASK